MLTLIVRSKFTLVCICGMKHFRHTSKLETFKINFMNQHMIRTFQFPKEKKAPLCMLLETPENCPLFSVWLLDCPLCVPRTHMLWAGHPYDMGLLQKTLSKKFFERTCTWTPKTAKTIYTAKVRQWNMPPEVIVVWTLIFSKTLSTLYSVWTGSAKWQKFGNLNQKIELKTELRVL